MQWGRLKGLMAAHKLVSHAADQPAQQPPPPPPPPLQTPAPLLEPLEPAAALPDQPPETGERPPLLTKYTSSELLLSDSEDEDDDTRYDLQTAQWPTQSSTSLQGLLAKPPPPAGPPTQTGALRRSSMPGAPPPPPSAPQTRRTSAARDQPPPPPGPPPPGPPPPDGAVNRSHGTSADASVPTAFAVSSGICIASADAPSPLPPSIGPNQPFKVPLGTGHGQEASLGTDRGHQTRNRRAVLEATDQGQGEPAEADRKGRG